MREYKINRKDFSYLNYSDIADCGGLKLAYKAYKRYESSNPESYVVPIGLQKYNPEKIFWLSFAQTYCRLVNLEKSSFINYSNQLFSLINSVERPAKMKNKVETDNHALDRFRVIGPLSNLKEFAETWSCPDNSPMNPKNKCALW